MKKNKPQLDKEELQLLQEFEGGELETLRNFKAEKAKLEEAARKEKKNPLEIEVEQDKFPSGMVSLLEVNEVSGNALVFFDWAEYCIWKLYPNCLVFLDGRFRSAYSLSVINEYFDFIYSQDGPSTVLDKYAVNIAIVHKQTAAFEKMLKAGPDWQLIVIGEYPYAALFLRKSVHGKFLAAIESGSFIRPVGNEEVYFP